MPTRSSSYQGLQKNIRTLKTPKIEVWRNEYADKEYIVTLENPEFTCVCPKTGLPDFADIAIQYKPGKWCVELKSFKMLVSIITAIVLPALLTPKSDHKTSFS